MEINVEHLPGETWVPVANTNKRYYISNMGRLMTTGHYGSNRHAVMKPAKDKKGYLRTAIMVHNKFSTIKLHRLVAIHFIPNPENKPQVNHKNGIKDDNRLENIEWSTASENMYHAFRTGLNKNSGYIPPRKPGSLNGGSKLTEEKVREIRAKFRPYKYTRKMLAAEYGVAENTIKDCILRSWKHVK